MKKTRLLVFGKIENCCTSLPKLRLRKTKVVQFFGKVCGLTVYPRARDAPKFQPFLKSFIPLDTGLGKMDIRLWKGRIPAKYAYYAALSQQTEARNLLLMENANVQSS